MPVEPKGLPFKVYAPLSVWLEKSAPEGRQRRIGGLISTETRDRQGEIVLQKGLDFSDFLSHGWFNDNHTKDTDGGIGYPEKDKLKVVEKGEKLPNGVPAPNKGTWAEGYLLESERGNKIWDTAQALQKAGGDRRLGFSIEGGILKRIGPDRKTIAKAKVRNVAITNCPVNTDTRMEALAKSLEAVEKAESPEELWKMLGVGTATGPRVGAGSGPQTGETAAQLLTPESLETDEWLKRVRTQLSWPSDEESAKLTKAEAIIYLQSKNPNITEDLAGRIIGVTLQKARTTMKTKKKEMPPKVEVEVEQEGNEEEEKSKSLLTTDELDKSLKELEGIAKSNDPVSRKDELLAKAQNGEDLTHEERDELFKALGGGSEEEDETSAAAEIVEPFEKSQAVQDALDVSEYLDAQHDALIKSLTAIGEALQEGEKRQHEYNLVYARAMHQMGTLIKSMSERLGILETQPARAPKSKGIPAPGNTLEKGFGGDEPAGEQLSKGQILDSLEDMMRKSMDDGREGRAPCGEDILHATAKYEQVNMISPKMLADVQAHRRGNAH